MISSLDEKEKLRFEAINVITTAYRLKTAKRDYPDKKSYILGKLRTFRKYLLRFSSQAKLINGNRRDTATDRVRRDIGEMREAMELLKKPLKLLKDKIDFDKYNEKSSVDASMTISNENSDTKSEN